MSYKFKPNASKQTIDLIFTAKKFIKTYERSFTKTDPEQNTHDNLLRNFYLIQTPFEWVEGEERDLIYVKTTFNAKQFECFDQNNDVWKYLEGAKCIRETIRAFFSQFTYDHSHHSHQTKEVKQLRSEVKELHC